MNKLLHFIFLSITLFLIVPSILLAQGPNPDPTPTPIDEGLLALSFFGVAFAVYRFMKKDKSKK